MRFRKENRKEKKMNISLPKKIKLKVLKGECEKDGFYRSKRDAVSFFCQSGAASGHVIMLSLTTCAVSLSLRQTPFHFYLFFLISLSLFLFIYFHICLEAHKYLPFHWLLCFHGTHFHNHLTNSHPLSSMHHYRQNSTPHINHFDEKTKIKYTFLLLFAFRYA